MQKLFGRFLSALFTYFYDCFIEFQKKMPSRPITSCKRYAVRYRDLANNRHELGFYAIDAFEARQLAIVFNKFVREHPNSIDRISLRNKVID